MMMRLERVMVPILIGWKSLERAFLAARSLALLALAGGFDAMVPDFERGEWGDRYDEEKVNCVVRIRGMLG